jgi:sec-independent protein translocase protein TatC
MNDTPQPLITHLLELRRRLIHMFLALILCSVISYIFSDHIFQILVRPLTQLLHNQGLERRLIYTGLTEAFLTYLKIAFFSGFFISFPYIANQIWLFIAPGLYERERRFVRLILVATPTLFLLGSAFAYFVVFPAAYSFFLSFEAPGSNGMMPIQLEPRVGEYLAFVMRLIIAFGMCFQLPVVLMLLASTGMVTAKKLLNHWRIAVVAIFTIAAIITPPDLFSMIGLAFPLLILYGLSIFMVRLFERRSPKEPDTCLISK